MIERIENPEAKRAIARKVLEALRDWFEVDESREKYIAESAGQIFVAAREGGEYAGFLCLKEDGPGDGGAGRDGRAPGIPPRRDR